MFNNSKRSTLHQLVKIGALLWLCLGALAAPSHAANLMRGPYLQMGSPTSIVVRWRTDVAGNSRVRYGLSPASLTSLADNAASVTDHIVTLSGLSPDTKYYYSIGSTTETLASGDGYFFVTSPASGKPTRVWVVGDSGTANSNVLAVRDAYETFAGDRHTDLWMMLGDNAYTNGTDTEFQQAVFAMFPEMLRKSALWSTRGNHERTDAGGSVYYNIFTLPTAGEAGGLASGSEAYYSFDYGDIHFICLDSYGSDRSAGGPMLTWLANDLANTGKTWIVAFWHHPPYSKGSHNSDTETELIQMRQNALPILEAGGVDLVLGGHSHSYERSVLLDGHYGDSTTLTPSMKLDAGSGRPGGAGSYKKLGADPQAPHLGAVYTVAGSSGQATGGALNHPAMYVSLNNMGSVVLDVDGSTMNVKFLRETGAIADYFTLQKLPIGNSVPPSITGPASLLPNGMISTPYSITMTATGDQAIVWSLAGGSLPPGMTFHPTGVYYGTPATAGTYSFTVRASNVTPDDTRTFTHTIDPLTQTPWNGSPLAIPGRIQAEDFDNGGEGLAFHDTTSGNSGGKYRNTAVDIETNTDGGAGFNIGWTAAGEWLEYTVNAAATGTYSLAIRLASAGLGATLHVEVDGVDRTGAVSVPNTGGWQTWQTVTAAPALSLTAGTHLVRVALDANGSAGGVANLQHMDWQLIVSPPAAPSGLTANGVSTSQIDLAWIDNASDEDGFKIERSSDGVNFSQIAIVGANATTHSNTGLPSGASYTYRVRAYNSGGDSPYSNTASAMTLPGAPAAPGSLTLKAVSSSQINLTWVDNASNESGFKIERSLDGINFTEIAIVGANVKTYATTGLTKNTRYYFRVRAYNASGNSAYSNTANTKTKPK
jgi:hypothetical protein